MRIEIIIDDKVFYSESFPDIKDEMDLEERYNRRKTAIDYYLKLFKYKKEMIDNLRSDCEMYLVFESKMNK